MKTKIFQNIIKNDEKELQQLNQPKTEHENMNIEIDKTLRGETMPRINEIRENWKVKEQGCEKRGKYFKGNNYVNVKCGINWICPTCKSTLKTTLSENLKEAESMLAELEDLKLTLMYSIAERLFSQQTDEAKHDRVALKLLTDLWLNPIDGEIRETINEIKAEWKKLRDEIKLKLEELK